MSESERSAPYLLFVLSASIFALLALTARSFVPMGEEARTLLDYADWAVCLLFLVDFVVSLVRAERRWSYFLRWGWIDLLSSIPAVDVLRWGRAARVLRILRVLRGLRASKILAQFILDRRSESALLAACLLSFLLVVTGAASILQLENDPASNIRSAEDAAWWAVTTITTVGYGDRYPVTSEGRLVAVLLMTAGVGLFGTLSGLVAAWFLRSPRAAAAEAEIARLAAEVRALRERLEGSSSRS